MHKNEKRVKREKITIYKTHFQQSQIIFIHSRPKKQTIVQSSSQINYHAMHSVHIRKLSY